ncbi:MAG: glycoside hydrolase family 31 protein [Terriglobia bacterium]
MPQPFARAILMSLWSLLFLFVTPCKGEWQNIGPMVALQPKQTEQRFQSPRANVVIKVLAPDLIRVRMIPGTTIGPDYSWAVVKADWPEVPVVFSGDAKTRVMKTSDLEVRIRLSPFRLSFYDAKGRLVCEDAREMSYEGERVRSWKTMPPDEHYYGLGEKSGPLDKRGHSYVMWNTDPAGYEALTDPMYQTVPFFLGLREGKAYGIFFDNSYRSSFDLGAESDAYYSFGAEGGEMNYYFFSGPDPKAVLGRFTELVGRTFLPPLWSVGYIQSSAYYAPEATLRFVAANFRQRHIPCDAVFFDTMHMKDNLSFTWDKSRFPNPRELIADLRRLGFHSMEIVDPGLKADEGYWIYKQGLAGGHFLRKKDGELYFGIIWPGTSVFPDFTSEKTRSWWAALMEDDVNDGIAGVLTDMNEPTIDQIPLEKGWIPGSLDPNIVFYDRGLRSPYAKNHNIYGMLMSAATREGFLKFRSKERPFVITRATYAGGQRYAAQWTGDNLSTWECLRASLRLVMSMGVSGMPFAGSDIGGFSGYPTAELYTRWLQAGVFHPFMWTHSGDAERTLDPWSFGLQYEEINRRTIELRYRLLPYLYNAFYQATQTGLPVMRPLFLDFPDDQTAMDMTPAGQNYEFMFGDDLLVAPVVKEGELRRKVYLPKGEWIEFESGKPFAGPAQITVAAPLDHIPIYVRRGAILPTRQVVEFVDQAPIDPLTFEVFPGGNSSRDYYEDDGVSVEFENGKFLRRQIGVQDRPNILSIHQTPVHQGYTPPARSLVFKIHGQASNPRSVKIGKRTLESQGVTKLLLREISEGAAYDSEKGVLWIKLADEPSPLEITVEK